MAKLKWGMVGGGEGSQIGPAHQLGSQLDGVFEFVAGALDHRPEVGREYAVRLGLDPTRAYGDWREMLDGEKDRPDRVDLVTVATPNNTHHEITCAFLRAGFHVLCEKPLSTTVEEAEEIVRLANETERICAVNYGYTGYPLVRQMREMVAAGDLGAIRLVKAEFAHGHHADAADADNPRIRWRYDPVQAGVSAQFADCGIHALHMACYVTGQSVDRLSADAVACIASRELEDDAMVNFRMDGGTVGRLWTSSIALGRQHGLTIQVFGEKGGMAWAQEQPNQLMWTPLGQRTQIIERGAGDLYPLATHASRVTVGHAEGMTLAFANIYRDLGEAIRGQAQGVPVYPTATDGLWSMAAISAVADSARHDGAWRDARPPMFR